MNNERYIRQLGVPGIGPDGQQRLRRASVLIVGCGALGSAAAMYLAGAGVGNITLMDFDAVAEHNLPRQVWYTEREIGAGKALTLAGKVKALNSAANVQWSAKPFSVTLPDNNVLEAHDVILGCTDTYASKILLAQRAANVRKPCVIGAVESWTVQVATLLPGHPGSYAKYARILEDEEGGKPTPPPPVASPTPGVTGCLQAAETIKIIAGAERTDAASVFFHLNLQTGQSFRFKL